MNLSLIDRPLSGPEQRVRRIGVWAWACIAVVFATLLCGALWFDRVKMEPIRAGRYLEQQILSLRDRRPAALTPRQWESAVAWTSNLHGNSLVMFQASGREIREFSRRLESRLSADVDLDTIFWIWDEYSTICRGGAHYQRFRSQMVGEIEAGGADWNLHVR